MPKTAATGPFGLFEFVRILFALSNAATNFQTFMHDVRRGLETMYVDPDGNLVARHSEEQHPIHLRAVFGRLDKSGITINASKCKFGKPSVTFLGHIVQRLYAGDFTYRSFAKYNSLRRSARTSRFGDA